MPLSPLFTPQRLAQAAVVCVAAWGMVAAVQVVVPATSADLAVMQTRWQIDQWASGKAPQPGIVAWGKARNAVAGALQTTPNDPNLHENLAYLYASRAQVSASVPDLARDLLQQALLSYQRAAQLRPMSGPTWANIAQALHGLYPDGTADELAPMWLAFDKAMAYGQREPSVQLALTHIGLARWAQLTAERQQALRAMIELANPDTRKDLDATANRNNLTHLLPPAPDGTKIAPNQ